MGGLISKDEVLLHKLLFPSVFNIEILSSFSGCWNGRVPLYTEGVGIERFHCIQRCLHFMGVGIERFHCIYHFKRL